jgi:hypothetical protein
VTPAPAGTPDRRRRDPAGRPGWRTISQVALLAAVTVGWAATPFGAGGYATVALTVAILAALGGVAQLALTGAPVPDAALAGIAERTAIRLTATVRAAPWPEILIVVVLALEAGHGARPWHTAFLGAALLSFLFAFHLAETGARTGMLRPQLPLLAAGTGLLVIAVGAAALPASEPGSGALAVRVIAAIAALIAAGLATPVWLGRTADR